MTPAQLALSEWTIKQANKAAVSEPAAYSRYAGGRAEPWCAHFVSWVFDRVGQPLPGYVRPTVSRANPTASASYLYQQAVAQGALSRTPKVNDLIFYKNSDPSKPSGHVGIVTDVGGGKVISVEGNLSDTVARVTHSLSDPKILGYGRFYRALPLIGLAVTAGSFAATWYLLHRK